MDEQERRELIAANEAAFRRYNENVNAGTVDAQGNQEDVVVLCECGQEGCGQVLPVAGSEYERVRGDSRCFLVAPGHEQLDTEDVLEEHERFHVVRKHVEVTAIVERSDPRRDRMSP